MHDYSRNDRINKRRKIEKGCYTYRWCYFLCNQLFYIYIYTYIYIDHAKNPLKIDFLQSQTNPFALFSTSFSA